jgi:uncharacterized membrane protein YagU involved in acid resistance
MADRRTQAALAVLAGGVVAGTLDILFAITFWAVKAGVQPSRILQSVAAGLLGRASFAGGWKTAALGLVLHFFIAISMAFVYYLMATRWLALTRRPWTFGAVYGFALYLVMNYIVVPLSAASPGSRDALWIALSVVVHVLLIGVPIGLAVRRAVTPSRSAA